MQPKFRAGLAFVIGALLGTAPAQATDFKVRLSSQPKTLDWSQATTGSESAILQNLMRGLFEFDSTRTSRPDLALSSTWDKNSKVLTLRLRTSVKWTDGRALKCQDFRDGFERLLNPNLNSANASLLFDVEGARDYFFGKVKDFRQVGVQCEGDDRLVLRLREPRLNLPSVLTHWATYPYRKDHPELTLGAYEWADRTALRLKKRDPRSSGPATVQFVVVPDGSRALLDYEQGTLQYLLQVEDDLLNPGVLKTPGLGFVDPIRVVALLHLNPFRAGTDSPELRRGIMARMPLAALIEASPNVRVPASSLIPAGLPGGPLSPAPFQVVGAARAPTEALTLGYPNDALSRSIAQLIQEKAAGLKIKIEPLPATELSRYDLILSLFGLDYLDADQLLSGFLSQGTLDLFKFTSAELVQLVQQARATREPQERARLYGQAADFLQNRAAIAMPLFYRRRAYVLSPDYEAERGAEGSPNLALLKPRKHPKNK